MARNNTNSPRLPEAPQGWFKSNADRLLIALNMKKPGPKHLADRKFIKTVRKTGEKAKEGIKSTELQLVDRQSAQKRYEDIIAYVRDITTSQTVSVDEIEKVQAQIKTFQSDLDTLIETLKHNEGDNAEKLQRIKEESQELWNEQEELLEALKAKATPTPTPPAPTNTTNP